MQTDEGPSQSSVPELVMQCQAKGISDDAKNLVASFSMKSIRHVVTKGKSKVKLDKVNFPHADDVGDGVFANADLHEGEVFYEVIMPGM